MCIVKAQGGRLGLLILPRHRKSFLFLLASFYVCSRCGDAAMRLCGDLRMAMRTDADCCVDLLFRVGTHEPPTLRTYRLSCYLT